MAEWLGALPNWKSGDPGYKTVDPSSTPWPRLKMANWDFMFMFNL